MFKIVIGAMIFFTVSISYAHNQDSVRDEKSISKQSELIQERMENRPTSTTIGGSRGGLLEENEILDNKRKEYVEEKNKKLDKRSL